MSGSQSCRMGNLLVLLHVFFVNDPMKGYAILMETMLYEMEKIRAKGNGSCF